jgi:hypothetical protein
MGEQKISLGVALELSNALGALFWFGVGTGSFCLSECDFLEESSFVAM